MVSEAKKLTSIPYEWFRQMRETNPVWYDEKTKMWNVFRYDDVSFVLTNPQIFSSEVYPNAPVPGLAGIHGMDDPRHRKVRSLISQAFTPRMIVDLAPRIEQVTNQLLDAVIPNGEMDIVQDLAYPLPLTIISELLGVPPEDLGKFRQWSNALLSNNTPDTILTSPEEHKWAIQTFFNYFREQLEEHKSHPRDDLITKLLDAEVDGEHLGEKEILSVCLLLMAAGNETTANLIGNSMLAFQDHPGVMEELIEDPSLIPAAIEEIVRHYPSIVASERFTTQDFTLAGTLIPAQQPVLFRLASANMDEAHFEDPQRFDIRRNPNKHLSFGQGVHYCLAAPLARLESRIAISTYLKRLQNIQPIAERPAVGFSGFFTFGVQSFPISFTTSD